MNQTLKPPIVKQQKFTRTANFSPLPLGKWDGAKDPSPPSPNCPLIKGNEVGVRITAIIVFAFTLLFLTKATAQLQDWLSYYPSVSRIHGKLIQVYKYGKPTYGENPERDEKVEVPILILQTPVRIRARSSSSVNNESLSNISFVQLIFPAGVERNYSKYLGQDIVVAGTLVRGHRGEHFTEAVMTVKAVNPTGKPM